MSAKDIINLATKNPGMVPEMINSLKGALEKQGIKLPKKLSSIADASGLTGIISKPSDVSSSIRNVASADNVKNAMDTVNTFNSIKWVVIFILVVWAIALIIIKIYVTDKKTKETIEYSHKVIFGDLGIIPAILCLWFISIILVTILPTFIGVVPSLGTFVTTISDSLRNLFFGK